MFDRDVKEGRELVLWITEARVYRQRWSQCKGPEVGVCWWV